MIADPAVDYRHCDASARPAHRVGIVSMHGLSVAVGRTGANRPVQRYVGNFRIISQCLYRRDRQLHMAAFYRHQLLGDIATQSLDLVKMASLWMVLELHDYVDNFIRRRLASHGSMMFFQKFIGDIFAVPWPCMNNSRQQNSHQQKPKQPCAWLLLVNDNFVGLALSHEPVPSLGVCSRKIFGESGLHRSLLAPAVPSWLRWLTFYISMICQENMKAMVATDCPLQGFINYL